MSESDCLEKLFLSLDAFFDSLAGEGELTGSDRRFIVRVLFLLLSTSSSLSYSDDVV